MLNALEVVAFVKCFLVCVFMCACVRRLCVVGKVCVGA